MHCPRCGQQQLSSETKFCSRCGFQLGLVAEVLANGGYLPQLNELYNKKTGWLTRKNGVIFSVFWFLLFLFIFTPIFGIANVDELAGVSAILGVFGGLILLIGSLVLLKPHRPAPTYAVPENVVSQPVGLYGNPANAALPPMQSQPATTYAPPAAGAWRAPDTGEFARPPSVIENTTKLLQKDEDKR